MKPRIENLISKKLVGIQPTMSLANNRTSELWKTFMPKRREIANLNNDLIRFLLTTLAITVLVGCHKPTKLPPIEEHFNNQLRKENSPANFEENTEFGFIKVGNFLNADIQNAIVIRFDSTTTFSVYELKNDQWEPIYEQKDSTLSKAHSMEAYIEDYNFDGIKDIGIRNEISNGAAIMSFHLWLAEGKTYRYVPEFEVIGNPIIVKHRQKIQGFRACCVFSELTLADYQWDHNKLINTSVLEISNYPSGIGIEANLKNLQTQTESKIDISENEIAEIIDMYSTHWQLVDTTNEGMSK